MHAYGQYNCSIARAVTKLETVKNRIERQHNCQVFLDNEEIITYGYQNNVLIATTKSQELLIFSEFQKLNLFIIQN